MAFKLLNDLCELQTEQTLESKNTKQSPIMGSSLLYNHGNIFNVN